MTLKPIVPRRLARQDIESAVDSYAETAGSAAAARLVDALEAAFAKMSKHPSAGSPRPGY